MTLINNSVNILELLNRWNELITWEKIFIQKHAHHIMNFEVTLLVHSLKSTYADHQTAHRWHPSASPQCKILQSIWIENGRNNTSSGKQITLLGGYWYYENLTSVQLFIIKLLQLSGSHTTCDFLIYWPNLCLKICVFSTGCIKIQQAFASHHQINQVLAFTRCMPPFAVHHLMCNCNHLNDF